MDNEYHKQNRVSSRFSVKTAHRAGVQGEMTCTMDYNGDRLKQSWEDVETTHRKGVLVNDHKVRLEGKSFFPRFP